MNTTDEATRARYAIEGWPRPVGDERCTCTTADGGQCRKRRAPNSMFCEQHQGKKSR